MLQTDSITYFQSYETDAEVVFHRPRTPYQAIQLLPGSATEAEKDEIVQKYFKPVIVAPSKRPDTLYLPGLKAKGAAMEHMPKYSDGFFTGNAFLHPELRVFFTGIAGDPVPYQLQSDTFVTCSLMLSFFVVVFIIARSARLLGMQFRYFFHNYDREQIFALKSESEVKSSFFIVLLSCFLLSLLFFNYTQVRMTSVFNQVPPYKLLLIYTCILLVYYALRYVMCGIVHWTFFSPVSRGQWSNAHMLIVLAQSLLYFMLVLVVVYFDLSIETAIVLFICILALAELMIFYKIKQIFFGYTFGTLHLFLYFCTLEIVPLLVLWKVLVFSNQSLIEII